jgi:hypothetical protein
MKLIIELGIEEQVVKIKLPKVWRWELVKEREESLLLRRHPIWAFGYFAKASARLSKNLSKSFPRGLNN